MHQRNQRDEKLVSATQQDSNDAFEQIVREQSAALFHFVSRFVGDRDTASDICQQVFIQLYLFLPGLQTNRSLAPWLFHVARNYCIDEKRRKRPIPFSELERDGWQRSDDEENAWLHLMPDPCQSPDEVLEQAELQALVREAINALPPKFRAVVSLRYAAELSYAEIGARLHIPPATAKTYFQRAKPLLRALLIRRGIMVAA